MTKQQVKVEITTAANFTVTADDAVVAGQGTAAYSALEAGRDQHIVNGANITFIPYHAVDHAIITLTQATVADPDDPTCVVAP